MVHSNSNGVLTFGELHKLDIIGDKELIEIYCPGNNGVRVYEFEFTRCDSEIYNRIKDRVISFIEPKFSIDKDRPYLRISLAEVTLSGYR